MRKLILTNKGKQIMSTTIFRKIYVLLKRIETTTLVYTEEEIKTLETLTDVKQTADISEASVISNDNVKFSARLNNNNVEEGYYIKSIGIYVSNIQGDETYLFAVAVDDENSEYMTEGGEGKPASTIVFDFYLKVDDTKNIIILPNPEASASVTDLYEHKFSTPYEDEGVHGIRYTWDRKLQVRSNEEPDATWETVETRVKTQGFSISTTDWKPYSSQHNKYKFKKSVDVPGLTEDDILEVNYDLNSIGYATECDVSFVESAKNKMYVYAKSIPNYALTGTLVIQKGERGEE